MPHGTVERFRSIATHHLENVLRLLGVLNTHGEQVHVRSTPSRCMSPEKPIDPPRTLDQPWTTVDQLHSTSVKRTEDMKAAVTSPPPPPPLPSSRVEKHNRQEVSEPTMIAHLRSDLGIEPSELTEGAVCPNRTLEPIEPYASSRVPFLDQVSSHARGDEAVTAAAQHHMAVQLSTGSFGTRHQSRADEIDLETRQVAQSTAERTALLDSTAASQRAEALRVGRLEAGTKRQAEQRDRAVVLEAQRLQDEARLAAQRERTRVQQTPFGVSSARQQRGDSAQLLQRPVAAARPPSGAASKLRSGPRSPHTLGTSQRPQTVPQSPSRSPSAQPPPTVLGNSVPTNGRSMSSSAALIADLVQSPPSLTALGRRLAQEARTRHHAASLSSSPR